MVSSSPWRQTLFLAREGQVDLVCDDLARPGRIVWPSAPPGLAEAHRLLTDALPATHHLLVDLSILCHLLVTPAPDEVRSWAGATLDPETALGLSWGDAREGRWAVAPIPAVEGGRGKVLYFVVGAVASEAPGRVPSWAGSVVSGGAAEEIDDAFSAARALRGGAKVLVAVPLMEASSPPVREHSLGLPLALAAVAALSGEANSPHVAATGDIGPDGAVTWVAPEGLGPKASAVRGAGFSLMLFPSACPHIVSPLVGLETAGVSTLAQAWRWARLYTPGGAADLNCLEVAVENPRCFVANCGGLSPPLVAWCREEGRFSEVGPELQADPGFLRNLCDRVEECLAGDDPLSDTAGALAPLLPDGPGFEALIERAPAIAFRWCSARFAVAARDGCWKEAGRWARRAEILVPSARRADPDAYTRFVARRVRFGPRPDAPIRVLPAEFQQALACQKEIHRLRGGVDPVLGELHEAAARHYGCRGPAARDETLGHVRAAQAAFGGGEVAEWAGPWRRQHRWSAFALLDSGDWAGAERAVLTCLGVGSWGEVAAEPRVVSRHLTVRFLGDVLAGGGASETLVSLAETALDAFRLSEVPSRPGLHLWVYNLGRLQSVSGRHDRAREAWRRSVDLCRGVRAPPASVLLPLAALAAIGPLEPEDERLAKTVVERWDGLPDDLAHGGPGPILARIHKDPIPFFPFDER